MNPDLAAVTCVTMETSTGSHPIGAAGAELSDSISQEPLQPPPGKLRKTAFKFFGGRKSICVLPSFFGGRGKGQGKGSSKTGVTKSRTHDGVSRGCWEEGSRGSGDVSAGDFEFRIQKDSAGNPNGSPQKPAEAAGKSQSLPRPRRGLRGLFSSIRRHKKSKNVELEKNESLEMTPSVCKETVPVALETVCCHGDDGQGSVSEPVVPVSAKGSECATPAATATECMKAEALVPEKRRSERVLEEEERRAEGEVDAEVRRTGTLNTYRLPLCADSELARLTEQNLEGPEADPPSASDHMSLIFGDVSSLKSFDSLTGCGDIIADQDDDSVAESSVSGERSSRNAGKRSSCFVTYQGGGEEMATPDEVDGDYLQGLWEAEVGNEVCYLPTEQTDSLSITPEQPISSLHANTSSSNTNNSPLGITETALTPGDLLTPQSDQQESVPNSDEGYYDSTTPGADEEARDRVQPERLPRDSYSGDALYELYEPDDRLLSPPPPPNDPHQFLGIPLQSGEGKGSPVYALKTGALETGGMETEEARLSRIQQALLCCELQSLRNPSKEQLLFSTGHFYGDPNLCESVGKPVKTPAEEPLSPRGKRTPHGAHALKERPPSQRTQDSPTYGTAADSGFSHLSKTPSPSQESVPYSERDQHTPAGENTPSGRDCSQSQEELMVCFSQALVDFTKHARHYHNSTESLDGSESSSPFGQTLQVLPAIVTFDVVDMENEGECEEEEPAEEEEELASPYEPYKDDRESCYPNPPYEDDRENCYLQQDAFAECDERTFDTYEQSLLLGSTWGIASLPRHISLGRPCQPGPAPLALNRRSHSLDTDSLELYSNADPKPKTTELYSNPDPNTELYFDPNTSKLYSAGGTPRTQHDHKRAASLHRRRNGHLLTAETRGNDNRMSRQPGTEATDGWRLGRAHGLNPTHKALALGRALDCKPPPKPQQWQQQPCKPPNPHQQTPARSSTAETRPVGKPVPQSAVRPSHLPLQSGACRSYSSSQSSLAGREGGVGAANQALVEGGDGLCYRGYTSVASTEPPLSQWTARPVGVTQGVPKLRSDTPKEQREMAGKSRRALEGGFTTAPLKRTT